MTNHNQDGAVNGLVISLVLAVLLLIGAVAFGGWAFSSRQDYKNNTDGKVSAAVTIAKQQQNKADNAQFAQDIKKPLTTFNGPEAYGSIVLQYPKTWSGYVDDSSNDTNSSSNNTPVNGYFYPGVVPSTDDPNSTYALRIQVLSTTYAQSMANITQLQQSQSDQDSSKPITPLVITPYTLPKLPKVVGVEVSGTLPDSKNGVMVILPLRSETLELWTEGGNFTSDFNNNILPNFSFSP